MQCKRFEAHNSVKMETVKDAFQGYTNTKYDPKMECVECVKAMCKFDDRLMMDSFIEDATVL